ncbi:antitoxin [Paludibaculum fermentans]|uniref:antitoxin n=1 Tax=Paludibaculum fermentans TaxID=1473598 RepID=UPI003EBA6CD6
MEEAVTYAWEAMVFPKRRAKVFKNGRRQAVRIPRGFELPGKHAVMRKEGEKLILEAVTPKSLLSVLATLAPLAEEFPEIPNLGPRPVEC